MPRKGTSYLPAVLSRDEAVKRYGESAVRGLGRWDNLGRRGINQRRLDALERSARPLHDLLDGLEVGSVAITAKERGEILAVLRDLLAILRNRPDEFRSLRILIRSMTS